METAQIITLSIIQGITEFLPISSSGHLNLVHALTNWPDQGLLMDISVHIGTILAVMLYFREDIKELIISTPKLLLFKLDNHSSIALNLIIASIPIICVGFIVSRFNLVDGLRTVEVIAITNLIFAIILFFADSIGAENKSYYRMGIRDAFLIGLVQIFAIIPGASRSGVTMTMARFLGYRAEDGAKFSMLLSIPTILGAGVLLAYKIFNAGDVKFTYDVILSMFLSFVVAYFSIGIMLAILRKLNFIPFVIYRVILSLVLFKILLYP